jgi:DNA polymerase family B
MSSSHFQLRDWIAFDLEWIVAATEGTGISIRQIYPTPQSNENSSGTSVGPAVEKIVTFGYEDSSGNTGVIDLSDFTESKYPNPQKAFLEAIKETLIQYSYCFAWGSRATRRRNEETGEIEGIDGDLVVLDKNFRICDIPSIIRYDDFSGRPYIRTTSNSNPDPGTVTIKQIVDIDLLQVFAKPLIRTTIFKNRYKGLHLDEVATSLLGCGKIDSRSGASINVMSIEERKRYCKNDAHLVAELLRIQNGDILKMMKVMAYHTKLRLEEVCHKGMSGIWTKILNDEIGMKIRTIGYDNIPYVLRKLYSTSQYKGAQKLNSSINFLEDEYVNNNDSDDEEKEGEGEYTDEYNRNLRPKSEWHALTTAINNTKTTINIHSKYKGGLVLEPARGLHHDVHVFDVTSLYPTMIIKYNLSPETVNCGCCRDDTKAKEFVTPEIMDDCEHTESYSQSGHGGAGKDDARAIYWICQRRQGLFPNILKQLTDIRINYKNQKLDVESQAIKAIINSGYGVFGHPYFKYYDPRVAELVTAFGRQSLTKLKEIAHDLGFDVLYGDTDSIFVKGLRKSSIDERDCEYDARKFIEKCRENLGLDLTHENIFNKLILVGKKHYVGFAYNGNKKEHVIKGMEGIKSDRPEFVRRTFLQLICDLKDNIDPLPKIRKALDDLNNKSVPVDQLAISLVLCKNPEDYEQQECKQRRLGLKRKLRKGDTLIYYKTEIVDSFCDPGTRQMTQLKILESDNPNDICYSRYKDLLLNSVKDILEILGYDIDKDLFCVKRRLKDSVYFNGNSD